MRNKGTTTEWMAGALLIGLSIVLVVRMVATPGGKIGVALQATARWSFVLFWLAYTGNALSVLFGARFQALAQHCRDFSLSFARLTWRIWAWSPGCCTSPIHPSRGPRWCSSALRCSGSICWRCYPSSASPQSWIRHCCESCARVGVEYIALVFLVDFAKNPFQGGIVNVLIYLPFLAWPSPARCCGLPRWRSA